MVDNSQKPDQANKRVRVYCRIAIPYVNSGMYSFRELTFRKGDIIFVKRQIDKNWYEGEHNAMVGLFPINYVEVIYIRLLDNMKHSSSLV